MNSQLNGEYLEIVSDLLRESSVLKMDDIKQHAQGFSCLDHCIFVSYVSFCICKKLNLDAKSAARAGLLHDLYLCDWSTTTVGPWERLLIHPEMALRNAEKYGLSELEKDIILKHMWPVTIRRVPRHRESAVVNFADKICASAEFLRIYKLLYLTQKLSLLNRGKLAREHG